MVLFVGVCEIYIWCTKGIKLFFCEVLKGYFPLPPSAPFPPCVDIGIAYDNFAETVKSIHDVLFVCFCASHRKFPLSPAANSVIKLLYAEKGRQHFYCPPLNCLSNIIYNLSLFIVRCYCLHEGKERFCFPGTKIFIPKFQRVCLKNA